MICGPERRSGFRAIQRSVLVGVAGLILARCASYSPAPLEQRADLLANVATLTVPASDMPLPELASHSFDPSRPLDMDEVAMVAVVNNPDLKAMRKRVGVAGAQAFAAGLLPNPQVSFGYGFLAGGPGAANSVSAGISQDIVSLLSRSARRSAAAANEQSVQLSLLWQEWQIVSQARTLFVRTVELARQRAILETNRKLFDDRYRRSAAAMKRGDEVLPTVTSDLVALQGVETQIHDLDQLILRNRHDLSALLGLAPEAELHLADTVEVATVDAAKLNAALPDLARRRPDLLALASGYQAQEQKLRQAIIEQFPAMSIGPTFTRDTTPISTLGPSITLSLPILNHNQGNIAIEKATRQQLHDEYQARLDAAYGAAARLLTELQQLEEQYRASTAGIDQLRTTVSTVDRAYRAGNFDERNYVDVRGSLLAKEIEAVKIEQVLLEQRVALRTLIGSNLPVSLGTDLAKG
jgi:outer membrane protein TolC